MHYLKICVLAALILGGCGPVPTAMAPALPPTPAAEFSKAEGDVIPVIGIPLPSAVPIIDGRLEEKAWQGASVAELSDNWARVGTALQKTQARLMADRQALYLGLICHEELMEELKVSQTERDSNVWKDDAIEFFFYPGKEDQNSYFHVLINAGGTVADERDLDMAAWNAAGLRSAVSKDQEKWTIELMLPWKDLGIKTDLPADWRLNITRTRPAKGDADYEDQSWSPTLTDTSHVPARFGFVIITAFTKAD